jgi:hypothetical protein
MSDASVIREFLVTLGYRVDGTEKFVNSVERATKIAEQLGAALEAVAAAVTAAVTTVSEKFESLYYASQRVRSSVANIRAFDYAVSQLGGTAAGARASLEGFGDFLRMNPGGEGLLHGLGVQTRDVHGNLRQTTDLLAEFGQKAKAMPYYQARAYASMMGIDPRTLDALMRGTAGFQKHYLEQIRQSGVDQDKAAGASARWAQRWRDMVAQVSLFTDKLTLMLQGPMGRVIDWFKGADRATHGLSTALIALGALVAPLLLVLDPVVVAVLALSAGLAALAADYQNFKSGAGSGIDWGPWAKQIEQIAGDLRDLAPLLQGIGKVIASTLGPVLSAFVHGELKALHDQLRAIISLINAVRDFKHGDRKKALQDLGEAAKAEGRALIKDQIATVKVEGTPLVSRALGAVFGTTKIDGKGLGLAGQVLSFFQGQGWTQQQAAGVAANLFTESGLNAHATGDHGHAFGIGQWHADRQAAYAKLFGHTMQSVTDPQQALKEQLAFVQWELTKGAEKHAGSLLKGATGAYQAGALFSRFYERPKDVIGEAARRGLLAGKLFDRARLGTNVEIHQKTEIHVHGSDAKSTAHAVAAQQDRVNGNIVRWARANAS